MAKKSNDLPSGDSGATLIVNGEQGAEPKKKKVASSTPALNLRPLEQVSIEKVELVAPLPQVVSMNQAHLQWLIEPLHFSDDSGASIGPKKKLYGSGANLVWSERLLVALDQERLVQLGQGRRLRDLLPEDHALAPGQHHLVVIRLEEKKLSYQVLTFSVEVVAKIPVSTLFLLEPGGSYWDEEMPLVFALSTASNPELASANLFLYTRRVGAEGDSFIQFQNTIAPATLYHVAELNAGDYLFHLAGHPSLRAVERTITINKKQHND